MRAFHTTYLAALLAYPGWAFAPSIGTLHALRCMTKPRPGRLLLVIRSKDSNDEDYWPERTHQAWSFEDDSLLWKARDTDLVEVAQLLERGVGGCFSRLNKLQDPNTSAFEQLFVKRGKQPTSDAGIEESISLRPFSDCVQRIQWDYALDSKDFSVGYRDRFEKGIQEVPWDAPNTSINGDERSLIAALPEHRIAYIKYKRRLIWHKNLRLDRIFGSGRPIQNSSGERDAQQRIQDVIRTYDTWISIHSCQEKMAVDRACRCLGPTGKDLLASFKKICQRLIEGGLTPEEFVTMSTSDDLFGPKGWGAESPTQAILLDGPEDLEPLISPPLVDLLTSMPEEHTAVLRQVLEIIAAGKKTKNRATTKSKSL